MKLALGPLRTACKTLAPLGRTRTVLLTGGALLMVFAACAQSDEEGRDALPAIDGGSPEGATIPDAGTDGAEASAHVDAEALRCSGEYCLVDLPNAAVYGLSSWLFAGVHVDPQTGAWAIANGEGSDEGVTAQLLHFENGGWKVKQAVKLAVGADTRGVRLLSISGDGKGNLLAVGTTTSEPRAGVILRGDGTSISVTAFEEELYAAYFASPDTAFIAGAGGRIFRSTSDGDWVDESAPGGNFVTIWGSGPDDLYVGGAIFDEDFYDDFGYLGHRTLDDAGAKTWSFVTFAPPDTPYPGFRENPGGCDLGHATVLLRLRRARQPDGRGRRGEVDARRVRTTGSAAFVLGAISGRDLCGRRRRAHLPLRRDDLEGRLPRIQRRAPHQAAQGHRRNELG